MSQRFQDSQHVANGGMGCIEAARDPVLGRRVAIKTLRPELRDNDLAFQQFVAEARVTGQLEHPNVVPVYDLGDETDEPFIVMRLVNGKSLTQLLEGPKPADSVQAADLLQRFVNILLRLCDALAFAHSRGIFHCDVKADNVMVGEHGEVYLMDWGVALTSPTQEGAGGTAAYMAPEQLLSRTEDIDARTDVFGLGGLLYEILTGNAPNDGKGVLEAATDRTVTRDFRPRELWNQLPPELCRIAAKALAPVRDERYQSVGELRADLEQFLKGGGWFETLTFEDGQSIVAEGEPGNVAYVIQSGNCQVWKNIAGERRLLRTLGPGDVFGEAAVFGGGPRTASIVAHGPVTLKVVTGDSLNRELDQNPMLAAFVRSLANLFREADAALSVPPPPPVSR